MAWLFFFLIWAKGGLDWRWWANLLGACTATEDMDRSRDRQLHHHITSILFEQIDRSREMKPLTHEGSKTFYGPHLCAHIFQFIYCSISCSKPIVHTPKLLRLYNNRTGETQKQSVCWGSSTRNILLNLSMHMGLPHYLPPLCRVAVRQWCMCEVQTTASMQIIEVACARSWTSSFLAPKTFLVA
jgi:hypothetical protein